MLFLAIRFRKANEFNSDSELCEFAVSLFEDLDCPKFNPENTSFNSTEFIKIYRPIKRLTSKKFLLIVKKITDPVMKEQVVKELSLFQTLNDKYVLKPVETKETDMYEFELFDISGLQPLTPSIFANKTNSIKKTNSFIC